MPFIPLPYAPSQRYVNPYAGTIADVLGRRGDAQAHAARSSGQGWAQAVGNIGQIAAGAVQDYAQQRAEAPLRARQTAMADLALGDAIARREEREAGRAESEALSRQEQAWMDGLSAPGADPVEVTKRVYGPTKAGVDRLEGLQAFQRLSGGQTESAREDVGRLARALRHGSPALRTTLAPSVREAVVKSGLMAEEQFPETLDNPTLDGIIAWATGDAPEKAPEAMLRDPRFDVIDRTTGAVITPGVPEEKPRQTLDQMLASAVAADDGAMVAKVLKAKRDEAAAERAPSVRGTDDPGPLETVIGPDGTPIRVPRRDAVGKAPASGTLRPASGLEKRALNFFNRGQQADADIEALESSIAGLGLAGQARLTYAPNWLQGQTGRLYTQAQRAFTEARLRKDSGAAIPEHEYENDQRTYFAQPGDGPEELAQKRRARGAILASLGFEAGQALGEFVGDAGEARRVVDTYRARAARPGAKGSSSTPSPNDEQKRIQTLYDELVRRR